MRIVNYDTDEVIFEDDSESMNETLVAALKANDRNWMRLKYADLRYVSLTGFSFEGVSVHKVLFCGSDLQGASFNGSILRRVNFHRAALEGVDFTGAEFYDCRLPGCVVGLGKPDNYDAWAWNTGKGTYINIGCKCLGLREGFEYWEGKDDRREVIAALRYADEVGRIRGWRN